VRARIATVVVLTLVAVACSGGEDEAAQARAFFRGADCDTLAAVLDQSDLSVSLAGPEDPTASLRETADFLADARERAPEDVRADVAVLARTYADLADGAEQVDWGAIGAGDPAATIPAARLGRRLGDPRFGRAALHLSTYAVEHCRG
jgi:hypothetical protein